MIYYIGFDFRYLVRLVEILAFCYIGDSEKLASLERTVPIGVPWPLQAVTKTMGTEAFLIDRGYQPSGMSGTRLRGRRVLTGICENSGVW